MKPLDRGMTFSVYTLTFILFVQSIFPYYLYATPYFIGVKQKNNLFINTLIGEIPERRTAQQEFLNLQDNVKKDVVEEFSSFPISLSIPGGPDQPEVQSFTPMTTDGMVDPFTGDFSYNIPLMDVDGYPINIGYNAGIGMDQEATWVGLGWNLNPGVINRSMRGIPDDFNGSDQIVEQKNQKVNKTVGVSVGADIEIFAFDALGKFTKKKIPNSEKTGGLTMSASLGVTYNNYTGYSSEVSLGPSFSIGKNAGLDVGMQFSSSTQGGASIGGNLGLKAKDGDVTSKLSIGSSFNSRQGLQQLSINFSQNKSLSKTRTAGSGSDKKTGKADGGIGGGFGSTFNFGMSTHVPQLRYETTSTSFTARFKLGPDAVGTDYSVTFNGFFMESHLKNKVKSTPAFGYMNLGLGQGNSYGLLDYNRENDGVFTINTPALPVTHLTYDIYSISGHGIGGSYRMDRKDIGHVFDPKVKNGSKAFSLGAEANLGATAKGGVDVGATFTSSYSSDWDKDNSASQILKYSTSIPQFRDASELSYDRSGVEYENIGGDKPVRFQLNTERSLTAVLVDGKGFSKSLSNNNKSLYFQSNQVLFPYSILEIKRGVGYGSLHDLSYARTSSAYDHHIGAFTVTKTDGMRYYYGLPAFSYYQENVSFAVGKEFESSSVSTPNAVTGLVAYSDTDASLNNSKGIDHYYSSQRTPAYVHTYMLTSVLSPNYVDTDGVPGPSVNDIGDFILFNYKKIDRYKWRNPVNLKEASYDAGLNTDVSDDKASFIHGEKELYYVELISTKNHVVKFFMSNRQDALSVNGANGGLNLATTSRMQVLDSIKLYSRPEYILNGQDAVALKTVHFKYDYSLCGNYPGTSNSNQQTQPGNGKLTLKEIYFTYQKSKKGTKSRYKFQYGYNPDYNSKNVDRWGTYKANPTNITNDLKTSALRNSDFPYVGSNQEQSDLAASAWNLSTIYTPSGGRIVVQYEADDYAYVQHKRANQMFLISGVSGQDAGADGVVSISDNAVENRAIRFTLLPNTELSDYVRVGDIIYFRVALSMDKHKNSFDYVPGYAEVEDVYLENGQGVIHLKPGKMKDSQGSKYNPMAISGVQFARNYLSRLIPPTSGSGALPEGELAVLKSLGAAFVNFRELFTGPNMPLWRDGIGANILLNKSWIRLQNPNYRKLGGGHRVKQILTYDNWNEMAPEGVQSYYGQTYTYSNEGRSTGVAAYEPQLGGEENVWRQYVANDIKLTWAPDSRNYMETPFGEQMFPSPNVGYSKVTVKGIQREGVSITGVGYTVNEFYTTKDFPTIVKYTGVENRNYKSSKNLMLVTRSVDRLALSQGFVIENNDMNGKPKSIKVFGEGQDAFLSSVEYKYQTEGITVDGSNAYKLNNDVSVIEKNGLVNRATIGRSYEAVSDFRESNSEMEGGNIAFNLNYTLPFVIVPMITGGNVSSSNTEFRSATFTKTIERKGILHQTVAVDNQSKIVTNNLAYDAATGEVLLTSVNNAFGDTVYNFTYPAHWIYDGMGQSSKNLGYESRRTHHFVDGYTSTLTNSQFVPGDEVIYSHDMDSYGKAWVVEATSQGIKLINAYSESLVGVLNYIKIIRSGRRNLQSTPVGTVTLSKNPLRSLSGNVFEGVLSAQAIQYDMDWKMFCSCNSGRSYLNPYKEGLKGNWFPTSTYTYLSNRTQEYENENTNIRQDGVFETYNPMFKLENGKWIFDKRNWTFTSQVTEFSPGGQPMETKDALSRYSTTQLGYNQTTQVAIGVNTQKRQMGVTNFEDYVFNNCPDKFIKWKRNGSEIDVSDLSQGISHTGKYSLKVSAGAPVIFSDTISLVCEPETLCDFSSFIIGTGGDTKITVPYSAKVAVSYEIISGIPIPELLESTDGITLSFRSGSVHLNDPRHFKVSVQLLDETGCFTTILIEI